MKVIWSPLAEQRALEAVAYIARDRPRAAAAWLEELIERVGKLDQFPRRGRLVREIGLPTHREILHDPYRIIYRVDASRVVILTLRHGAVAPLHYQRPTDHWLGSAAGQTAPVVERWKNGRGLHSGGRAGVQNAGAWPCDVDALSDLTPHFAKRRDARHRVWHLGPVAKTA